MNQTLEFNFTPAPIVFKIELDEKSRAIHERAVGRSRKYLTAEAELLESIIEIDNDKTHEKFGEQYITPYCVKYLNLTDDVAANFVRIARKSKTVPELKLAISDGEITVSKAKVIAGIITPENQNEWIEKTKSLSKYKLEKAVAEISPKALKPENAKIQGPDRVRVEFELTESEMESFRRAQDLVGQKLKRYATLAETQTEILKSFLKTHDPVAKAARSRSRKVKALEKTEKTKSKSLEALNSEKISDAKVASKIKNTAAPKLTPNLKNNAEGPAQQSASALIHPPRDGRTKIPAQVLHEVHLRDRGQCQAILPDGAKCGSSKWIHFHHIIPVAEGGTNHAPNLVTICSSHHRIYHQGLGAETKSALSPGIFFPMPKARRVC